MIEYRKVRTYVPPANLEACQLTPFVASRVEKERKPKQIDELTGEIVEDEKADGKAFLEKWKLLNGNEQNIA